MQLDGGRPPTFQSNPNEPPEIASPDGSSTAELSASGAGLSGQGASTGGAVLDHLVVVVVDDEPADRERIGATLRQAGALVMTAASAREACDVLDALLPDVLVSDMMMPGLSGCDLLEVVRTDPRTAAIPAVALTPDSVQEDQEQAYTAGFDFLLAKPVEPALLIETVATAAGRAR